MGSFPDSYTDPKTRFSLKSVADNIKGRVQFMRQIHVFLLGHLKRAFQEALKEKERGKNVAF